MRGDFIMGIDDLAMEMQSLHRVISTMEVPEKRKQDYKWLKRNLKVRNSQHPQIDQAMVLLESVQGRLEAIQAGCPTEPEHL